MKTQCTLLLMVGSFWLTPSACADPDPNFYVFICFGQSNMEGAGQIQARPDRNGGQGSLEFLVKDPATAGRFRQVVHELTRAAEVLFTKLGCSNITVLTGDGSFGLPDQAPFDRILVTAAAEDPPGTLMAQLKVGGVMVVPVGQSDTVQSLIRVTRHETGYDYDELRSVRFVPLLEGLGQD